MEIELETLGKIAFEVYSGVVNHKDYKGNPLPDWEHLANASIREGWKIAAYTIYNLAKNSE